MACAGAQADPPQTGDLSPPARFDQTADQSLDQSLDQSGGASAPQSLEQPASLDPQAREGPVMAPAQPEGRPLRPPREITTGGATLVLQTVEQGINRDEVAAAVQKLLTRAPVCVRWPSIWLQESDRWNRYVVRYDLMARDWGEAVAAADAERMEEFVSMGLLTRRERSDVGPGVIEYSLTRSGQGAIRGYPRGGAETPDFCTPAQRRLVEITALEFGRFPCGTLRVSFTHVSDDWPTWARAERTRARLAQSWPPNGVLAQGSVSLSRQWVNESLSPLAVGETNGALRSACYDRARRAIVGDDLTLFATP